MVLSAVGPDRSGLVDELSHHIAEAGCAVGESRMTVLGGEFAIIMLVSGNWNAVAKFENLIPRLQDSLGLHIHSKRTHERDDIDKVIPYAVEVVSIDRQGIVSDVANFFSRRFIRCASASILCHGMTRTARMSPGRHSAVSPLKANVCGFSLAWPFACSWSGWLAGIRHSPGEPGSQGRCVANPSSHAL